MNSIWLMLDSRTLGGIESHVCALASELAQRAWQVKVVLWKEYDKGHPMQDMLANLGVEQVVLDGSIRGFYQRLQQDRPEVIHTHGYKAGLMARLFKWCGFRLVSSFHAGETPQGKLRLYDWLDRSSARLCDERVAVSQKIAQKVAASCKLIPNFIRPPRVWRRYHQLNEIAFVGRLSEEKAPERFLALARHFPKHRFAVYGDGPLADSLMAQAPENVSFHGQVSGMKSWWPRISLLCIPSLFEGLPMAALEAMAHGVPVMASKVGDLPKLIQPGKNGWLLDGADLEQWKQHLTQWLQLSEHQQVLMRQQAHNHIVESYSPETLLPEFIALYQTSNMG